MSDCALTNLNADDYNRSVTRAALSPYDMPVYGVPVVIYSPGTNNPATGAVGEAQVKTVQSDDDTVTGMSVGDVGTSFKASEATIDQLFVLEPGTPFTNQNKTYASFVLRSLGNGSYVGLDGSTFKANQKTKDGASSFIISCAATSGGCQFYAYADSSGAIQPNNPNIIETNTFKSFLNGTFQFILAADAQAAQTSDVAKSYCTGTQCAAEGVVGDNKYMRKLCGKGSDSGPGSGATTTTKSKIGTGIIVSWIVLGIVILFLLFLTIYFARKTSRSNR